MHEVELILTIIGSCIASSGFWAYLQSRRDKKDARTQMLIGLGQDRLVYLAQKYIDRKWISREEYENLSEHLYSPYAGIGGNGVAARMMAEVEKLPIRDVYIDREGEVNL